MKSSSSPAFSNKLRTSILFSLFALLCVSGTIFVITVQTTAFAQRNRVTANSNIAFQKPKVPTSIVRGRAVYDDTGRPVRRARILLFPANQGDSRGQPSSVTNLRGEFQIGHVGEGTYLVIVDSPGVLNPLSLLETRELGPRSKPDLTSILKDADSVTVNGTTDTELKVHVRRGGTITGKVTYPDGDPAVNCLVGVSRKFGGKYSRTLTMIAGKGEVGVVTDDRGIYRLTNLPPGDYIVSATELNTRNAGSDGYEGVSFGAMRQALSFTYYPSESKTTSAVEINLAPGQEIKDTD